MLQKSQTAPAPAQQQSPKHNAQRISDLTVKELQPPHPLVNLPYPMNVNAPPASPPHEYLRFDFHRPDLGTRRATLPNLHGGASQRHSLDEPRGHEEEATPTEPESRPAGRLSGSRRSTDRNRARTRTGAAAAEPRRARAPACTRSRCRSRPG